MEKEIVSFSRINATLCARINCEIDHHTAGRLRARIDKEIFATRPEVINLDFAPVRFMDSSGIALILGRVETASAIGARVHLEGLSVPLFKLVRLSGIERIKNLTVTPAV
jgi:stage II sporulation protein AA (anti-sigma F factor antagonist)